VNKKGAKTQSRNAVFDMEMAGFWATEDTENTEEHSTDRENVRKNKKWPQETQECAKEEVLQEQTERTELIFSVLIQSFGNTARWRQND
jgi:hypothetical protein